MAKRQHSKPHSFADLLLQEKLRLESEAAITPPSRRRDALLAKIREIETTAAMNTWLSADVSARK